MSFEEKLKDQGTSYDVNFRIRREMEKYITDGKLPCAGAFAAAEALGVSPAEIGSSADRMRVRLIKCQLGLYGYEPEKKIVQPADTVGMEMEAAVRAGLKNGYLPCAAAWEIADRFKVAKMAVSAACETLSIKIKPCQLGAF